MSLWVVDFPAHGNFICHGRFPPGVIDRHSTILANICEMAAAPGEPLDFPFIGAAGMEIRNIAPRDDNIVDIWIEIDWNTDLNCRLRVIVF
jgi:hypothetical protein